MDSPYLTMKEAAEYLRMNEEVLRRYAVEGRIPHGKTGKKYVFHKDELDSWVKEGVKNG